MSYCALCKELASGENVVYTGKYTFVLVNLRAVKKGHIMVLPKRHVERYDKMCHKEAKEFFDNIEKAAKYVQEEYGDYPLIVINPVDRRSEPHIHAHLIPSSRGAREFFSAVENLPLNEVAPKVEREDVKNALSKRFRS